MTPPGSSRYKWRKKNPMKTTSIYHLISPTKTWVTLELCKHQLNAKTKGGTTFFYVSEGFLDHFPIASNPQSSSPVFPLPRLTSRPRCSVAHPLPKSPALQAPTDVAMKNACCWKIHASRENLQRKPWIFRWRFFRLRPIHWQHHVPPLSYGFPHFWSISHWENTEVIGKHDDKA